MLVSAAANLDSSALHILLLLFAPEWTTFMWALEPSHRGRYGREAVFDS